MTILSVYDTRYSVTNKMETRKDRFKRLATYRTTSVLDKIRLLGNLSNKSNYDYSDEDVSKIFSAIDTQLRISKALFNKTKKREFKL